MYKHGLVSNRRQLEPRSKLMADLLNFVFVVASIVAQILVSSRTTNSASESDKMYSNSSNFEPVLMSMVG
jgi:hypothetical protein